jgi:hypothetical protein
MNAYAPRSLPGVVEPMVTSSSAVLIRGVAAVATLLLVATTAIAAEPVYPIGSRVGLVAPGKLQPSPNMRGFEDSDGEAVLMIVEMPAEAYPQILKGLTAAALLQQGVTEEKRTPVTIAAGHGILISGHQSADGKNARKWMFIGALPDMTALIALQAPDKEGSAYSEDTMRAALATIAVRHTVPVDELLKLVPVVFDEMSGMRPIRVAPPNAVLLTDGPKDTLEAAEQPLLSVSLGLGAPEAVSDRANFARNLLGGMAEMKDARILSRDVIKLGTAQTFEIQAEGNDAKTGAPMRLVQWIRFGNNAYIRLVGLARTDNWRDVFPRFRSVRDGIKPRG